MSRRYNLQSLLTLIREPSRLRKAASLLYDDIWNLPLFINRLWYQVKYDFPDSDFLADDWDNLLLLDGCRYDMFCETAPFDRSEIRARLSPASNSYGFIEHHYLGRQLHDTVYVTANPHVENIPPDTFHATVNLLGTDWDEETETVRPGTVVERALEAAEEFRDKRLIVHFMQPHFPFIGEKGRQIDSGIGKTVGGRRSAHPWKDQMRHGRYDRDLLLEAYRENHAIVMPHVQELLDEIDGRSVITSDHANLIGEKGFPFPIRMYGHPGRFPHPDLLRVPWLEIEGPRRDVRADPPIERDRLDDDVVEARLESLGYR